MKSEVTSFTNSKDMTGASNVWNDARDPSTPFQVWLVIHVQGLSAIKVSIKFVVYLHPLMGHYEDIKTMQNVEKRWFGVSQSKSPFDKAHTSSY